MISRKENERVHFQMYEIEKYCTKQAANKPFIHPDSILYKGRKTHCFNALYKRNLQDEKRRIL